jgi:diacylglycerol kinase (ATP)
VPSRRAIAIVNPASSNGRTMRRLPALERGLRERLPDLAVVHTEGPGHATLICRDALANGTELVVSIGGDGTNNEVLCGFVDEHGANRFPDAELALVHSGTGGDFVRHLGPKARATELRHLGEGEAQRVDYGVATFVDREGHRAVRPFLNVASAGVSGLVDYYVGRSNKLLGPTATYVLGSLRGIVDYRNKQALVRIDGGPEFDIDLTILVVANGQYFGGGMWIAPKARCDDGVFDLIYAGGLSRPRLVGLLAKVFRGAHVGNPGVHGERARSIEVRPKDDQDVVLLDLDGEQPGRLPASFRIEPAALKLRGVGMPS